MNTHSENELNPDEFGGRFYCEVCGRMFKRLTRYKTHLSRHYSANESDKIIDSTQDFEYTCEICNKGFKTKSLLKAHQLRHGEKSFLCSHCGKGFVMKGALVSHLKVHTGERPYTCRICQKTFAHVSSFESHSLTHTGTSLFLISSYSLHNIAY